MPTKLGLKTCDWLFVQHAHICRNADAAYAGVGVWIFAGVVATLVLEFGARILVPMVWAFDRCVMQESRLVVDLRGDAGSIAVSRKGR